MPNEPGLTLEQRERVFLDVLGWDRARSLIPGWGTPDGWISDQDCPLTTGDEFFLIVDAMRAQGWWIELECTTNPDGWHATLISKAKDRYSRWGEDENATVAIALAALKALEAG